MDRKKAPRQGVDVVDRHTAVMSLDRDMLQRIEDGEGTEADQRALDQLTSDLAEALGCLTGNKLH